MADAWRFWIDRGGTFTDLVASSPCGGLAFLDRVHRQPLRRGNAPEWGLPPRSKRRTQSRGDCGNDVAVVESVALKAQELAG